MHYCNDCSTRRRNSGHYPKRMKHKWHKLRDRFRPPTDEWAAGLVNRDGTMKEAVAAPLGSSEEEGDDLSHRMYTFFHEHAAALVGVVSFDEEGATCRLAMSPCWAVFLAPILNASREVVEGVLRDHCSDEGEEGEVCISVGE